MYSTSVHGFLRLFQRSQGNSVRIASDEACDLLISKHHDQALKKLLGGTKRSMQTHFEWLFFLPQDKRDRNNLFWSLIGVDCVNREIHYHKLHTAIPEDEEAHIAEITQLLHNIDCLSSEHTNRPSWTNLPHVLSDCINTDSGIWICLLVQALVYRLPPSIITPMTIREARP